MSNRPKKNKRKNTLSKRRGSGPVSKRGPAQRVFDLYEYQITEEPVEVHTIPAEIYDEVEELHFMCRENPDQAIGRLENLLERYPEVHQIYNYLGMAYQMTGQKEKCDDIVLITYQRHPHYLFAKTAYAELCMLNGEIEKVPDIFDSRYDLKLLYPERKVFHFTEAIALFGTLGYYFFRIGRLEQAELFYNSLKTMAPDHGYTKRLRRCLMPASVGDRLKALFKR